MNDKGYGDEFRKRKREEWWVRRKVEWGTLKDNEKVSKRYCSNSHGMCEVVTTSNLNIVVLSTNVCREEYKILYSQYDP